MPQSISALIACVYLGVQGLLAAGTHTDVAGKQNGVAGGAILQLGVRMKRLALHAEGVPPVSLPQKPSAYYGAATPQLSLVNGALRVALDSRSRFWAGVGETIINQRTPLPNLSQVVASRLAGVRYEAAFRATAGSHFIEAVLGGAPHLTGSDVYTYSIAHPQVVRPEVAAEIDGLLALGTSFRDSELLVGLRSITFSARFALTGEAGDRNNGAGVIAEWRRFIPK